MRAFLSLVAIMVGFSSLALAQQELILTEDDNIVWIKRLNEEGDLAKRLELLRNRILSDTNVYVRDVSDRRIVIEDKYKSRTESICRPTLIIEGTIVYISNDSDNQKMRAFVKQLNINNIKEFKISETNTASALFGIRGRCGVMLITAKNKKSRKLLTRYSFDKQVKEL